MITLRNNFMRSIIFFNFGILVLFKNDMRVDLILGAGVIPQRFDEVMIFIQPDQTTKPVAITLNDMHL